MVIEELPIVQKQFDNESGKNEAVAQNTGSYIVIQT